MGGKRYRPSICNLFVRYGTLSHTHNSATKIRELGHHHYRAFSTSCFRCSAEEESVPYTTQNGRKPAAEQAPLTTHMRIKTNQRDLAIDVLSASATKREAKSYLHRFHSPPNGPGSNDKPGQTFSHINARNDVNLGRLFASADIQPVTVANTTAKSLHETQSQAYHIAIVVVRAPQTLSDEVLHGVTRTLSQLSQLGMHCIVMLDQMDFLSSGERRPELVRMADDQSDAGAPSQPFLLRSAVNWRDLLSEADRVVESFESHHLQHARRIDWLFRVKEHGADLSHLYQGRVHPEVENQHLLEQCFDTGTIPVVTSMVATKNSKVYPFSTKEAVISLSRALAGTADFDTGKTIEEQIEHSQQYNQSRYSVDRIIILDNNGGIPTEQSFGTSHVFVNLEQEYNQIVKNLDNIHQVNPAKRNAESYLVQGAAREHLKNLSLVRRTLRFLPRSSSALIASPESVARYEKSSAISLTTNVETRPQRNILIHNILADKPIRSSSLPVSRLASDSTDSASSATKHSATFLKHGMHVSIIPNPKIQPWTVPEPDVQILSLSDPRLDIGRLVHLIEDSFGRPLDQKHYFSRIAPSLAGIIIAGAYEGGAILTWERPPSARPDETSRLVPYLDKFAVLQRSQGAGGVADIVFSAMVRQCFPQGVCWRSRSNNPVNKWYFERAKGTCRLAPDANLTNTQHWTMFWTTENVAQHRFEDYAEVCRSIGSSWADGKPRLD